MKFIPCTGILICFVFGHLVPWVYSESNGPFVIQRKLVEDQRVIIYHCITTRCLKNYHAILCKATDPANPGKDECIPCGNNTFYPNETDTRTLVDHIEVPEYEICIEPDCNCVREAILVNGPACHVNGSKKICMCNAKIGYCGNDYKSCVKWNESDIGEGYQLTANCTIEKCEEGHSKPYPGYGTCDPTTGTTQPTPPPTSGASGTDVHNNSTKVLTNSTEVKNNSTDTTNTTTPSINEDKGGGLVPKIAIPLAFLVIMIIIAYVLVRFRCRKKFGRFMQRRRNAAQNNGVNNRLNGIPEEQNVSDGSTEATSMV